MPEEEKENLRTEEDLDSIVYGTPKNGGVKIYFNSRKETILDLKQRIDLAVKGIDYIKMEMGGE